MESRTGVDGGLNTVDKLDWVVDFSGSLSLFQNVLY